MVFNRLLRNRVSAQQARERKKAYLNDLEAKVKDLEKKNSELEERLSTLQNENQMLRHVCIQFHLHFILVSHYQTCSWKLMIFLYGIFQTRNFLLLSTFLDLS